jgi:hypothetical protein
MADKAFIGGRWVWAGGPYSGQPVDSTPANAGDLTPYLTPSHTRQLTQPVAQAPAWSMQQPAQQTTGQMPTWMQPSSTLPRNPWQDVLEGKPTQNFNPGGAFGVGKETLPSIQRWNRLMPSEQQGATGYWQDQLGVSSQDVMGLMQKLKPHGAMSSTPRWAGGF